MMAAVGPLATVARRSSSPVDEETRLVHLSFAGSRWEGLRTSSNPSRMPQTAGLYLAAAAAVGYSLDGDGEV
jgi:hypothetical protein